MVKLQSTLHGRINSRPEVVELDTIEKGDCLNDLPAIHAQVSGIGVGVGLAVSDRPARIEERDDHISVGIETSHRWHKSTGHTCVEWMNNLIYKFLLALIEFRHDAIADNGPLGTRQQEVIRATRSLLPSFKTGLNQFEVVRFGLTVLFAHAHLPFRHSTRKSCILYASCLDPENDQ